MEPGFRSTQSDYNYPLGVRWVVAPVPAIRCSFPQVTLAADVGVRSQCSDLIRTTDLRLLAHIRWRTNQESPSAGLTVGHNLGLDYQTGGGASRYDLCSEQTQLAYLQKLLYYIQEYRTSLCHLTFT
jgi:hypothetical protein